MKNVKRYAYLLLIPIIALLLGGCGELSKEEKKQEMQMIYENLIKAEFCSDMIVKYHKEYEKKSELPFEYQLGKKGGNLNAEVEYVQKCKNHFEEIRNINKNLETIIDEHIKSLEAIKEVDFLEKDYQKVRIEHRKLNAIFNLKQAKLVLNFINSDADLKYQRSQLIYEYYKLETEKEEAERTKDEEKLKILKTKAIEFETKVENLETNHKEAVEKLAKDKEQLKNEVENLIQEAYKKANQTKILNPRDSDGTFLHDYDIDIYDLNIDIRRNELKKYEEVITYKELINSSKESVNIDEQRLKNTRKVLNEINQ